MDLQHSPLLPQVVYSAKQVLANELMAATQAQLSLSELMNRAGLAVFQLLMDLYGDDKRYLVLTGKGNNAGDGFVVASALLKVASVTVHCVEDPQLLQGDARAAFTDYQQQGGSYSVQAPILTDYDVIIDALFGAGFHGQLPSRYQLLIEAVNQAKVKRLSIDVPSGVNANTGEVSAGAFCADACLSFIGLKAGLLTGKARQYVGQLYFDGLGVDHHFNQLVSPLAEYMSAQQLLALRPQRQLASYKNMCGHLLVIGGGQGMGGAARLAAEAGLRAGAGLVTVATHPDNALAVLQGRYELMVQGISQVTQLDELISRATCIVLGPGLGQSIWAKSIFEHVLMVNQLPIVIDADALNLLSQTSTPFDLSQAVLTPHSGEAGRLLNCSNTQIEQDRLAAIQALVSQYQATIVLKGPGSLIANQQQLNINHSGCGAMASAGMGDLLSGIIGALIAQGLSQFDAACLAVYIHGLAGEEAAKEGELGLIASDLLKPIRRLLG